MATQLSTLISQELNIPINQVAGTVSLLDDGATIPFISRYRKEQTGDLDELSIQSIDQRLRYYRELEKRRATILKTIEAQEKLTPELAEKILEICSREGIDTGLTVDMLIRVKGKIGLTELLAGTSVGAEKPRTYYDITGEKNEPSGDFIPDGPVSFFVDIEDSLI